MLNSKVGDEAPAMWLMPSPRLMVESVIRLVRASFHMLEKRISDQCLRLGHREPCVYLAMFICWRRERSHEWS